MEDGNVEYALTFQCDEMELNVKSPLIVNVASKDQKKFTSVLKKGRLNAVVIQKKAEINRFSN